MQYYLEFSEAKCKFSIYSFFAVFSSLTSFFPAPDYELKKPFVNQARFFIETNIFLVLENSSTLSNLLCHSLYSHLTQTTTWEDPRKKMLQQQAQATVAAAAAPTMIAPPLLSSTVTPAAGGITLFLCSVDSYLTSVCYRKQCCRSSGCITTAEPSSGAFARWLGAGCYT